MDDDIDDLLDEVETKFCVKKGSNSINSNPKLSQSQNENQKSKTKSRSKSKVDDDVNDILDLEFPDNDFNKVSVTRQSTNNQSTSVLGNPSKKCFPIYVGGSVCEKGYGSSVNKRICDCLRCTACDFKVCIFSDYEWNKNTDYLFLRNNAPDFHKLKSELKRKKGSNAYNCQCSWRNITDLTELKDSKLKWVCGKH